jgi:hypothetical protein
MTGFTVILEIDPPYLVTLPTYDKGAVLVDPRFTPARPRFVPSLEANI